MKASISYQELQKLVTEQTKKPISFAFVDQKTIKVLYELNIGLLRKKVGIDLKVLDVVGTDLRVRYSVGVGIMDSMVGIVLNGVKDKIPEGLLEEQPNHVLLVHLAQIDIIKPVFERIAVKDINMLAEAVEVVGDFK